MTELKIGRKAPALTLANAKGKKIKLSEFRGKKNVILYFYPKDNTPGCTKQAEAFRDDIALYKKAKTIILGVSPDDEASHQKFIDKFELPFELLCDVDKKICEKYGVWVEKNMYGRKYMGVQRATFLIDKEGTLQAIWPKVKVNGHSEEVLEALENL